MKKFFLILSLALIFSQSAFSQENSEEKNSSLNFPQWALYVRRAEIVTLGSLPFTTLGTTVAFGAYQYFSGATSTFPNPFDKTSQAYSGDNVATIIAISFSISAVIGIVDLIISIINHNKEAKRLEYMEKSSVITVVESSQEEIDRFFGSGSGKDSWEQQSEPVEANGSNETEKLEDD